MRDDGRFTDEELNAYRVSTSLGNDVSAQGGRYLVAEIDALHAEKERAERDLAEARQQSSGYAVLAARLREAGDWMAETIEDSLVNLAAWEHSSREDALADWRSIPNADDDRARQIGAAVEAVVATLRTDEGKRPRIDVDAAIDAFEQLSEARGAGGGVNDAP